MIIASLRTDAPYEILATGHKSASSQIVRCVSYYCLMLVDRLPSDAPYEALAEGHKSASSQSSQIGFLA